MTRRPRESDPDGLSTCRSILRRASDGILDECRTGRMEVPEPSVLCEEVDLVVATVQAHLASEEPPELPARRADRMGILDLLRARVLEEWPEEDGGAGLLRTMRAIEAARVTVSDVGETLLAPGVLTPYGHRLLREVAHTLRSPMGSIVMLAEMMAKGDGDGLNDLQRKHLRIMHRAALSLANMASDLLNLTREDAGAVEEPGALHVHEVVQAVADAVAPVAEERRLRFVVDAPEERSRLGRAVPLEKALMNLTLNAALLARDGELELSAAPRGEEAVVFRITVAPVLEDVENLFVVFPSPGDEADYTLSRSGLGFSTARDLVRRMGGDLHVDRVGPDRVRLSFSLPLPPHP